MTEQPITFDQFISVAGMLVASAPVNPEDLNLDPKGPMYVTVERGWLAMLASDIEQIAPGFLTDARESLTRLAHGLSPSSGVYFVRAGDVVKIGTSKDIPGRIRTLRTMSPLPLEFLGSIPGGRIEEAQLHREWAALRLHGEWFTATPDLLDRIAGLCASAQLAAEVTE